MSPLLLIIAVLWMPEPPVTADDPWYIERVEPLEETDTAECTE